MLSKCLSYLTQSRIFSLLTLPSSPLSLHCITVPLRANGALVILATDVMTEPDTLVRYTVTWSPSKLGILGVTLEKVLVRPPSLCHTSVPVSVTHVSGVSPAQISTTLVFG